MKMMLKVLFLAVILMTSVGLSAEYEHFALPPRFNILIIYSGNRSNEAGLRLADGVQTSLLNRGIAYGLEAFEINCLYNRDPAKWDEIMASYLPDILRPNYELIVAEGTEATLTLMKILDKVPQRTSVIFSNIPHFDLEAARRIHPKTTAVLRSVDPLPNVRFGMKLFPKTRTVVILTSHFDWREEYRVKVREVLPKSTQLEVLFLDNDRPETLKSVSSKLKAAEKDSFVVSLDWDRFFANRELRIKAWGWVKNKYSGPILVRRRANMPFGLCGVLEPLFSVGVKTGEYAEKVASGTTAEMLSMVSCPIVSACNMAEAERFGITSEDLPPGLELFNVRPPVWFVRKENRIAVIVGVFSTLVLVLGCALFVFWYKKRRQEKWVSVFDALPARVMVFDASGNVLFLHAESNSDTHILPNVKYRMFSDLPDVGVQKTFDAITTAMDSKTPIVVNYDSYGAHCSVIFSRLEDRLFGKPAVLGIGFDVGDFQEKYREAQNRIAHSNLALNEVKEALVLIDKNGSVVTLNAAAKKRFNYSDGEMFGETAEMLCRLNVNGEQISLFSQEKVLRGEKTVNREINSRFSNGTARYEILNIKPLKKADAVIGSLLSLMDVSALRNAEKTNERLVKLMEIAEEYLNVSFFRFNLKTKDLHPIIGKKLRFVPMIDGKTSSLREWIVPEDLARFYEVVKKLQAEAAHYFNFTFCSDSFGTKRHLGVRAVFQADEDSGSDTYREIIGVACDNTQQINERERVKEKSTFQKSIENAMPYPLYIKNPDDQFRYIFCNRAFAAAFKLSPDKIIGKTDYELFVRGSDADLFREHDRDVIQTGKSFNGVESYHDLAGDRKTTRVVKQRINGTGTKWLLFGMSVDISEMMTDKTASDRLIEFYATLFDRIPANIYVKDADDQFRYIIWNRMLEEQTGYSKEKVIGSNNREQGMPEDKAILYENDDIALMKSGKPCTFRKTFRHRDKGEVICNVYRTPVTCDDHHYLLGMSLDVTEQLKTSETMQKIDRNGDLFNEAIKAFMSNSDYRTAAKIVLEAFAHAWDADIGFIFRRENGCWLKESEFCGDGGKLLERYVDSEMPSVLKAFLERKTLAVEDVVQLPEELRNSAETLLAQHVKAFLFVPLFQNNRLYGQIGFIWRKEKHIFSKSDGRYIADVGDLFLIAKEHEYQRDRLNEQALLRETIFANIQIPLSLLDEQSNLLSANHMFYELFNLPETGILGKNCQEFCPKNHSDYCTPERCPILYVLENAKESTKTAPVGHRMIRSNAIPALNEDGKVQYVLQTHMDVTDLSREKQDLKDFLDQNTMIKRCTEILLLEPNLKKAFGIMAKTLNEYYEGLSIRVMRSVVQVGESFVEPFSAAVQTAHRKSVEAHSRFAEKDFAFIFRELRAGKNLSNRLGEKSNADGPQWRVEMEARQKQLGFSDVMLFPLFCKGHYWGYMDVDRGNADDSFASLDMRVFNEAKHVLETALEREWQNRDRLREKELTAQLFDHISIPMYLVDDKQKIRAVNQAVCDLLHMDVKNIIGHSCREGICTTTNAEECKAIDCPVRYVLENGKTSAIDYPCGERILHWQNQPIFGADGKVEYVLGSGIDVTDARKLQKQLVQQADEMRQLNSTQKQYLEQDRLIAECLEVVIFERDMDSAWKKVLSKVGVLLAVDGVSLLRFENTDPVSACIRNIWVRDASLLARYDHRRFSGENFIACNELLGQGKTLHGWRPNLHSDVPWEKEFINYFDQNGQNELAVLPIRFGNTYWGFLAVMQSLTPPISENKMRMLGMLVHVVEILINRELYLESEDSEEFQKQLILNSVTFPLVLFDDKFRIVNINDFAAKLSCHSADWRSNPDGCSYCCFRPECDPHHPREACLLNNALKTRLPQSAECTIGEFNYRYTAVPIIKNDKVTRILLSGVDITSSVLRTEQVRDELGVSQEKFALWRAFSFTLARQIRRRLITETPETSQKDSGSRTETVGTVKIADLLDTMNTVSKLESKSAKLNCTPTDITNLLEKVREKYLQSFRERSLAFDLNIATAIPSLLLESEILEEVLSFFVKEALLFTSKGGVQITAEYAPLDQKLTLSVRDTGIGMDSKILSSLLHPEWPSDAAAQYEMHPVQLQILLYRELIHSCGGTIQANSQKGRGSCFRLVIPAASASSKTEIGTSVVEKSSENAATTVLVVDDVMMNLKVISMMLKKMGYTAVQASSGQSALSILKETTPLCVLSDIWMPEMNGVELANKIRKEARFDDVPLFAVTADAESERSFDMRVFQSILIKPVTIEKLKQLMEHVAARNK